MNYVSQLHINGHMYLHRSKQIKPMEAQGDVTKHSLSTKHQFQSTHSSHYGIGILKLQIKQS